MPATPRRSPHLRHHPRGSPYQLRSRTPTPNSTPSLSQASPDPGMSASQATGRRPRARASQSSTSPATPTITLDGGTRSRSTVKASIPRTTQASTRSTAASPPLPLCPTAPSPGVLAASPTMATAGQMAGLSAAPMATAATPLAIEAPPQPGDALHATGDTPPTGELSPTSQRRTYQLVLRPIVKATDAQRDTSAETLDDISINGSSFRSIQHKIWNQFSDKVKGRAVKTEGEWSVEMHSLSQWDRVMQFRAKKKVVESTKSEQAWRRWLLNMQGHTVTLVIYEYGLAIARAQDRDAFVAACIQPMETDRAGATAECGMRDVVQKLQEQWGSTFQTDAVVWRMWANHLTRNLNRSIWEAAIRQPPPVFVASLLRMTDSRVEQRIADFRQSTNTSLNVVLGTIADYDELQQKWEVFGEFIKENKRRLEVRKEVMEGFLPDLAPPSRSDVMDPLLRIENVDGTEHAV